MPEALLGTWFAWSESHQLALAPEDVFVHLYGAAPVAIWLDSNRQAYGMGRWSIMGAPEGPHDEIVEYGGADACARVHGRLGVEDVWEHLARRIDANPVEPTGLPFAGGYVGTIGYGVKSVGQHRPADGPDAQLVHLSRFLIFDHHEQRVHLVATGPPEDEPGGRAWIAATWARIENTPPLNEPPPAIGAGPATASVSRGKYLEDLSAIHGWLEAGDSYEACYTYALHFATTEPAFETYRRLRRVNPAPYAAYLRLPGREILSCSPERYLSVTASGWAETKPIKGTARRCADPAADAMAARALAADPKVRSENLMIVDLLRNDLGRVSAPGTVRVATLMGVESYATVHQLVTSIRARLLPQPAAGVRAASALYPPGSMTGAPKRRTVELLDALEAEPRGVYSGVIGHFSRCGAVDLSVVIRTAVVAGGAVTIGTGGAITIQSDPMAELDETIAKSGAVLGAFGRSHPFNVESPHQPEPSERIRSARAAADLTPAT